MSSQWNLWFEGGVFGIFSNQSTGWDHEKGGGEDRFKISECFSQKSNAFICFSFNDIGV